MFRHIYIYIYIYTYTYIGLFQAHTILKAHIEAGNEYEVVFITIT